MSDRFVSVRVTGLSRKIAAVHLLSVGLINLSLGAVLAYLRLSGTLVGLGIAALSQYSTAFTTLNWGDYLTSLHDIVPIIVAVLLVLGVWQIRMGTEAFRGRHFTGSLVSALVGLVNPVAIPLSLIVITLFGISRQQFD